MACGRARGVGGGMSTWRAYRKGPMGMSGGGVVWGESAGILYGWLQDVFFIVYLLLF